MNAARSLAMGEGKFAALLPGITSALSFSAADILGKVVFNDGMDVLSFISARGVLTVLFFLFWLRGAPPRHRRARSATSARPPGIWPASTVSSG